MKLTRRRFPEFASATTRPIQRRSVYLAAALMLTAFLYADLPGLAMVSMRRGSSVHVMMFCEETKEVYCTSDLSQLMRA